MSVFKMALEFFAAQCLVSVIVFVLFIGGICLLAWLNGEL